MHPSRQFASRSTSLGQFDEARGTQAVGLCAQRGFFPAVVQASIGGVKLRWRTDWKVCVPSMVDFAAVG